VKKPRGLIVQILDSFFAARVKHSTREEQGAVAGNEQKPSD
jgi:hypothetical protein